MIPVYYAFSFGDKKIIDRESMQSEFDAEITKLEMEIKAKEESKITIKK